MNRLQVRRGGALALAGSFALVVLAACGSPGEEAAQEDVTRVPTMSDAAAQATQEAPPPGASPETGEETLAAAEATPADGGEAAAAMSVEVVSYDIYFEPKELTIPADTDMTFVLPNNGVTPHNFAIDALEIDVDIAPGATEEIVVNAPAGGYEYYCNVPGHKEAGMVGMLIASEEAGTAPAADEAAATPAGAEATPAAAPGSAADATPAAEGEATPAAEATPVGAGATPEAAGAASAVTEPVEVASFDIYFEPKEVSIPANTDVTFVLPNEGVTPHNFSIDELGVDVDIAPGETQEAAVNAPAGTYEYYCNVPGHKPAGMVGTLTVE